MTEEQTKPVEDKIPKRLAALEVYKVLRLANTVSIILIVAVFIVAIVGRFNRYGGATSAGIISAGAAWFLWKIRAKMQYLQNEYKIAPPKKKFQLEE